MGSLGSQPRLRFQRPNFQLLPIPSDPAEDSESGQLQTLRSLPDLVHYNAVHNPNHIFCLQATRSPKYPDKMDFTDITFFQLACAVENCCSWILRNLPGAYGAKLKDGLIVQKAPSIALFLESDVGLFIYILALLTLNIPVSSCQGYVSPRTAGHIESALQHDSKTGNSQAAMYTALPFEDYLEFAPASQSFSLFDQCRLCVREQDQNVTILHSSGTTGLPKAIPLAHRYLLGYAACHEFPPSDDEAERGVNLSTLPLFHGFGILAPSLALSVGKPVCFPPSSTIGNGSLVLQMVKAQHITSVMTVPTILEEIVQSSAAKELAPLDFVVVGGGPIKNAIAEALHEKGVNLLNHFGATELGALAPIFRPDKSYDWRFLRLRRDLGLHLKRLASSSAGSNAFKLFGTPFGSKTVFELQDHVELNSSSSRIEIRLKGRKDDLLVLATGEKVSPHVMEEFLEQDAQIKRAIIFGNGQFETGVLLEPVPAFVGSREDFVESIWPVILEANSKVDQHACITAKAAVLVKPPDKSIPLSDKGLPQRKEVYSAFESDIRSVYERLETKMPVKYTVSIDSQDPRTSMRDLVQSCLPSHIKPEMWKDNDDFVQLGMDSLQATRLRRSLNLFVWRSDHASQHSKGLPPNFVYSHPSINKLIGALGNTSGALSSPVSRSELMSALSDKYSFHSEHAAALTGTNTILLTGATGNLGSHLLEVLSEHPHVPSIICLARVNSATSPSNVLMSAMAGQRKAFDERGIELTDTAWSKIRFMAWQPGKDRLGMREDDYYHVASTITHIFHGAWPMDFQMKLSSFENQIKTVHDLVSLGRFAHRLRRIIKPRIILASSIAAVGNFAAYASSTGRVPEMPIREATQGPLAIGYAEAKWPMIVRIGQLSGSQTRGYWSVKEHFPTLVKSSMTIGHLPDLQGTLSWLPVDQAAHIVADLLLKGEPRELFYHLENPVRQSWPEVLSILEYNLSLPHKSRLAFSKWLDRLSELNPRLPDVLAAKKSAQEQLKELENLLMNIS
ncbi:MAG: hypothetical protein Q9181_005308 [Wetmoreana brouardii]